MVMTDIVRSCWGNGFDSHGNPEKRACKEMAAKLMGIDNSGLAQEDFNISVQSDLFFGTDERETQCPVSLMDLQCKSPFFIF